MTTDSTPPPLHGPRDQARAWRAVCAICDHDGVLLDAVVREAAADARIDELVAALARNLVARLGIEAGMLLDDVRELAHAELAACLIESEAS